MSRWYDPRYRRLRNECSSIPPSGLGGRVLTDIFSLDIPFSRMKGGKNPVFGKLKSIFQHENEDKVSAAAGAVVFIDAEALQIAVCEIRHGGRGEENSFHGKPPFFLGKDWKQRGISVFTE